MPEPTSAWRPLPLERFLIGVCHFPEQEPKERLALDAKLMAEVGIETVRMGEFAWSIFEPEEGVFDFALFDDAIEELASRGIDTILCTPTATPPRWLTDKYPEILRVDESGQPLRHGSRQHVDVAHPLFLEYSRRITRALADHYRANPHVIGWQTDNEFNTHFSETHSPAAQVAFREWLEHRYGGDIGQLNAAWGTAFWNRQYNRFEQIETPIANRPASADPSHLLDYRRFLADITRHFQREQVQILRATNPEWFVFHNIGRLNDMDLKAFGCDLDFLGTDLYPGLRDEFMKVGLGYAQAFQLDSFRGWSGNFIVPEMQVGGGAHPDFALPSPEPGELGRFAMSAVARGADGIVWFRWTSARYGAEAYWMGILDHDRVPRRRYDELKKTIADLKRLRGQLLGTCVEMDVAILANDWENEIAQSTFSLGLPSLAELSLPLHHSCYLRNIACGFASPDDDFSRASIVFVPHLPIWKDEWTRKLTEFAASGGIVIVGARTATRTANNHVREETPPGPLAELCGITVEEFGRLPAPGASSVLSGPVFQIEGGQSGRMAESANRVHTIAIGDAVVGAAQGYEILRPTEAVEVVARWNSRALAGHPAITMRAVGTGSVVYVGTFLTHALVAELLKVLLPGSGVRVPRGLPEGVELTVRSSESVRLAFLQNCGPDLAEFEFEGEPIHLGGFETKVVGNTTPSPARSGTVPDAEPAGL